MLKTRFGSPRNPLQPSAGERVREQLLEAAGAVFAEKGYDRATSKEICERAGMNSAAVNYHFGGIESLYAAALAHAHHNMVTLDALREIAAREISAKQKLHFYIEQILRRLTLPSSSWEVRLISREILSPSPARETFVRAEILPKVDVLREILAELIGVAPDDAIVGRTLVIVMAPFVFLATASRETLITMIPTLADPKTEIDFLVDHFECFVVAGLKGLARQVIRSEAKG